MSKNLPDFSLNERSETVKFYFIIEDVNGSCYVKKKKK